MISRSSERRKQATSKAAAMACPYCGGAARIVYMKIRSDGLPYRRYACHQCKNRWSTLAGELMDVDHSVPVDWRVKAHADCQVCGHHAHGYCSLGIPESQEAGFVTECEARVV